MNFDNIPKDLKNRIQWLVWRLEGGKKVPYYTDGTRRKGAQGSPEDLKKMATFEQAKRLGSTHGWSGIGFAMLPNDGLVAVDLDDCLAEDGTLSLEAESIIEKNPGYWEITPSKQGLRAFFEGHTKSKKTKTIEVYCGVQFLTVTGDEYILSTPLPKGKLTKYTPIFKEAQELESNSLSAEDWIPQGPESEDYKKAEIALGYIDPDCAYNEWLTIGQALCNGFGKYGLPLFLNWSAKGSKFEGEENCSKKYKSIKPVGGVTLASLFSMALTLGKMPKSILSARGLARKQDEEWQKNLVVDKDGNVLGVLENVVSILENDPNLPRLKYNLLTEHIFFDGETPWVKQSTSFVDSDYDYLMLYLAQTHFIRPKKETLVSAVSICYNRNAFNPVQDYLMDCAISWDGRNRVDTWLIDWCGAENTEYTRLVGRKFLCGAAQRAMRPGVKFDHMLVLEGTQGLGKSSLVRILSKGFFTDSDIDFESKDSMDAIRRVWFAEHGELAGLTKAEVTKVKSFLTRNSDHFRPAYGRVPVEAPRKCVFVGTTNESQYLKDDTGNRRFWPVRMTKALDQKAFGEVVDQLWAEVMQIYNTEKLYLDEQGTTLASAEQSKRMIGDEWEPIIRQYLDQLVPEGYADSLEPSLEDGAKVCKRLDVCVRDIFSDCFHFIDVSKLDRKFSLRVASIMDRQPDFEKRKSGVKFARYGNTIHKAWSRK